MQWNFDKNLYYKVDFVIKIDVSCIEHLVWPGYTLLLSTFWDQRGLGQRFDLQDIAWKRGTTLDFRILSYNCVWRQIRMSIVCEK